MTTINMNQTMDGKTKIKNDLLNYFNESKSRYLKPLDNKYRDSYTGVTINYLTYDLFKAKYRKSDIAQVLLELQQQSEIKSIFCPDIKKFVFEPIKSHHTGFCNETGGYQGYVNPPKQRNVHTYLKTFIKN